MLLKLLFHCDENFIFANTILEYSEFFSEIRQPSLKALKDLSPVFLLPGFLCSV